MKGGIHNQINYMFEESGIFQPGTSKHQLKEEARTQGATTWEEIGRELPIVSYGTAETYLEVWHNLADHLRDEFSLRDIERLTGDHIKGYLEQKADEGISRAYFGTICAALTKLEKALNMFAVNRQSGHSYDFRQALDSGRQAGHSLVRHEQSRGLSNVDKIVAGLSGDHQVVARLQLEGGARISEAALVKEHQLKGNGIIQLDNTKGGLVRDIRVTPETYARLAAGIDKGGGQFRVDKISYGRALRATVEATGQKWTGSHALRWTFAQQRFAELRGNGSSYEQALHRVSREMGHQRPDITEHYLR